MPTGADGCYDNVMRIMGIDYGRKRLGLALSDPMGITAQPLQTLEWRSLPQVLDYLVSIVKEKQVERIVIGQPREMDGSPGKLAEEINRFASQVEDGLGVPVERWDERLTTAEAERLLIAADVSRRRRRHLTDRIAAALMLQAFLDAQGR